MGRLSTRLSDGIRAGELDQPCSCLKPASGERFGEPGGDALLEADSLFRCLFGHDLVVALLRFAELLDKGRRRWRLKGPAGSEPLPCRADIGGDMDGDRHDHRLLRAARMED